MSSTSYARDIVYSPEDRDFACYLNGELVSFSRTHQEGEALLDELVTRLMAAALVDDTVYCEACGVAVDPDAAVLDGELMVCQGCAPCSATEFEAMQMAEAKRLMAAEMAAPVPDPETWQAVSEAACEPVAPAGAVEAISRAELFDSLCSSVDELRDYWRDVPRRLKAINEAWEVVLMAEAFYFNAQGDLLVESSSRPGTYYAVGHSCPCTAGRWGNHCRHSIVADIIGRAVRIARLKAA